MYITARAQQVRMSPRKVRLVLGLIRGMKAEEACHQLMYSSKEAARPILKVIRSAIANAEHNEGMSRATLVIKTATAQDGQTLSRWMPRAHGRATPLKKRSSHITIVLEGPEGTHTPKKQKTKELIKKGEEMEMSKTEEGEDRKVSDRRGPLVQKKERKLTSSAHRQQKVTRQKSG